MMVSRVIVCVASQTAMSSKIIGTANEFFANMAVDAVMSVRHEHDGKVSYSVKAINILKSHGKSATEVGGWAVPVLHVLCFRCAWAMRGRKWWC